MQKYRSFSGVNLFCRGHAPVLLHEVKKRREKMTTDLAKKTETFKILANAQEAIDALKNNLNGENLSPMDLDRVGIPPGGGSTWCVPTLEGEVNAPEIVGVIIGVQNCRAYWAGDYSGGGDPPDCVSEDASFGVGDPGGNCHVCPLASYGSDSRGKGQACKQIKRLFVLRPASMLPLVVNLPPTSLKAASRYLLRLVDNGLKYQAVVTRITLEKTKNSEGISYSLAVFSLVGKLDPDQARAMADYAQVIAPMLRAPVTANDFTV
jgi:hypothetical protein